MDESVSESPVNMDSPKFKAAMKELGITRDELRVKDKLAFMQGPNDPMDIVELRWKNHQQEVKKLYKLVVRHLKTESEEPRQSQLNFTQASMTMGAMSARDKEREKAILALKNEDELEY
jgi:hypothetical protein